MNDTEKSLSVEELLQGVWRHRWLAAATALGVVALGAAYLAVKPEVFTASTVVRIEAQALPEQYVAPTVTERIEQRLGTVRHELLSRPILAQVIEELGLYAELRVERGLDAAVEALRASLEVKVEGENAFAVTVKASTAELAARIANRLPEVYVEQAAAERAEAADRAAAIFEAQLAEVRPRVEALEAELTAFKAKHAGKLPEALEANLRQLDRLTGLSEGGLTALADAQRRRTMLARHGAESSTQAARLGAQLDEARRGLASLRAVYTDGHPEVAAATREVQGLEARFSAASRAAREGDGEAARIEAEIATLAATVRGYQERMDEYLARVDATPAVGAELGGLARDYEAVRAKYQTLVSRKIEAELAKDLERRQKASLFRVVEPAFAPSRPAEPNPVSVIGLSLLVGFGLAFAVASYKASRDTSIRSVVDARARLGLPVLAAIPALGRKPRG